MEAQAIRDKPFEGATPADLSEAIETEKVAPGHPFKILIFLYRRHLGSIGASAFFYVLQSAPLWVIPIISSNIINYATAPQKYHRFYF